MRSLARSILVSLSVTLLAVAALPVSPASAVGDTLGAVASSAWQTNAPVRGIGYAGGIVYVGGEFTSVRPFRAALGAGEVPRTYLAAFDAASGELVTTFDHVFNDLVNEITPSPDGSIVYVGGKFTTVDGEVRKRLAAFDVATGALLPWAPLAGNPVSAIATFGTTVYVGGSFNGVNGTGNRTRLAAIDADGTLLPWNPTADGTVQALAVTPDGSRVVIGGYFTNLSGVSGTNGIGWANATTGAIDNWLSKEIPTCSVVKDITTDADTIYVAGEGTGGGCFDGTFAVHASTSALKWKNNCLGATQAVMPIGDYVYKGSHAHNCASDPNGFPEVPPNESWHLLAQNESDGTLAHWFPNTNGVPLGPKTFGTDGQRLFVGGDFKTVNKKPQQGFAIFDSLATSNFKPRRPNAATGTSPSAGKVKITFGAVVDDDDQTLTYQVFRDGGQSPVGEVVASSKPWSKPTLSFTDTGLTPGSQHSYKVRATDGVLIGAKSVASNLVTVSTVELSYRDTVLADAPYLYWRLGETGGTPTAGDTSGNARTGRYESGVAKGLTGALVGDSDKAASFDGTVNGLVRQNSSQSGPQTFSVEAWFKTTTNLGGKILGFGSSLTGESGTYDRHVYMTNSGQLVFGVAPGGVRRSVTSPGTYNNGQWHHVVGTVSPSGMDLYVDGASVASSALGNGAQAFAGYWRVGYDTIASSWPTQPTADAFNGTIDEFAVYTQALGAGAVVDHYNAGT